VGFVVDKAALGQIFSQYFDLPCQIFHRLLHAHNHPLSSTTGTAGHLVASVIVNSVPLYPKKRNSLQNYESHLSTEAIDIAKGNDVSRSLYTTEFNL
jgi:hypothetical protein